MKRERDQSENLALGLPQHKKLQLCLGGYTTQSEITNGEINPTGCSGESELDETKTGGGPRPTQVLKATETRPRTQHSDWHTVLFTPCADRS